MSEKRPTSKMSEYYGSKKSENSQDIIIPKCLRILKIEKLIEIQPSRFKHFLLGHQKNFLTYLFVSWNSRGSIDVGDEWLYLGDNFWILVTEFRYWWHLLVVGARHYFKKIEDVGDKNGQSRHQHLKVVANTFRLQHLSLISM